MALLPPSVITALRDNPQDKIVLRCHDCPGETKWIEVFYDNETGFTWRISPDEIDFDSHDDMHFDTTDISTLGG